MGSPAPCGMRDLDLNRRRQRQTKLRRVAATCQILGKAICRTRILLPLTSVGKVSITVMNCGRECRTSSGEETNTE